MKKRILSILLTLVMVIGMLPTVAFAADGTLTWGKESNGTPYVQWDADEFSYGASLWVKIMKDDEQLIGTDGAFRVNNNTGGKLDLTQQIRNGGSGEYVVEISAEGKTLTSAPKSFKFDNQLKKPTLSYNAETVTLSWNDVGAAYYLLTIYKDTWNLVFKDERVDGTSIDLSEWIPSAGSYSVALKAISEDFTCSSSENALTTINKDSTLSEITGLKVNGLTASWDAFDDATEYWIKVKKVGGNQVEGVRVSAVNFDLNRAVSHKWGGEGTYEVNVIAFKNSVQISNETSVNFDFEFEDLLKFNSQSPEMPSGKTTTWLEYVVDEPAQFRFNHDQLVSYWQSAGYDVEKYARLEGLWGDLMTPVEDTTDVTNGYPRIIDHTFDKPGMYKLTETLRLKDKDGNIVATKTHVFNINVVAKPPVTPTITQQPTSVTGATGSSATLTAKATDAASAQWYKVASNGFTTALTGSFSNGTATLTVNKSNNAIGDRYYCIFKSEDGSSIATNMATVCFVPTVTSGSTVTVTAGQNAYLKVTASGCDHYDNANGWYKDGVSTELSSGGDYYVMGTTLCILAADASDAGTYTYKYVTHGKTVTGTVTMVVNSATSTNTIDTFDITGLDNPVILGTTADTYVSVPGSAKYTVESVTWTAGVNSSGVVTGSSGMVSVKLKAKSGYTFKSGDLRGTVEGITKTVYSVPSGATSITVNIDYNSYSSWKIVYPENDTVSISTDSLTFRKGIAANGQKIKGSFTCTHGNLVDTNLHHKGINFAVYNTSGNAMPAGLTLNKDGTITGTPTAAGVYTVFVEARSVNANGTASNCSGLVVKMIKIVVASENSHDWDIEHPEVITPATCTTDGVSRIKCKDTGCTAHQDVTVPSTGHNWGEWPTYIVPTCKDGSITITRTCGNANCPVKTESKTINGLHMAMDWTTDATDHWKVCGYCETKILVEKDAHKDTNSDNKCDVCEYDMTPAVQPTTAPSSTTEPGNPTDVPTTEQTDTPTTQPTTAPSGTTAPGNPTDTLTTVPTANTVAPTAELTTQPTTNNSGESSAVPTPTTPEGEVDGNNLWWLWILIAAVAVGGIVLFVILGKKKKEQ